MLESLDITLDKAREETKKLLASTQPTVRTKPVETATEDWRNIAREDFAKFIETIAARQIERRELGIKKYNTESFMGDPLEHAINETLDTLFYLWAEGRRQKRWS